MFPKYKRVCIDGEPVDVQGRTVYYSRERGEYALEELADQTLRQPSEGEIQVITQLVAFGAKPEEV